MHSSRERCAKSSVPEHVRKIPHPPLFHSLSLSLVIVCSIKMRARALLSVRLQPRETFQRHTAQRLAKDARHAQRREALSSNGCAYYVFFALRVRACLIIASGLSGMGSVGVGGVVGGRMPSVKKGPRRRRRKESTTVKLTLCVLRGILWLMFAACFLSS